MKRATHAEEFEVHRARLIGLGYRALSMSPLAVGPIKTMVRSLQAAPLTAYIDSLLDLPDASLRDKLRAFARDHGVIL